MAVVWVIVVVVLILAVAVVLCWPLIQRQRLRRRFGAEYDRAVADHADRRSAERELKDRERRHSQLELRELPAERKRHFADEWAGVQEQFIDNPDEAVHAADRLVTEVMAERGYPTTDYDQQVADLSVEHGGVLDNYRNAHAIALRHDGASTEDMRTALVHYRALFAELLDGNSHDAQRGDKHATGSENHKKDVLP
ncbi:hypothetical protein [Nocardia arthritidis]|uniref:Secreted protein n=1 Tax=Nocardia arthritidis TaxID=228602 RepID=A0A6G9YE73_9NOCA|nr:hypothetical protein [Nocardia arthritidis]QIS11377.1 hypothetical protein F5544_17505 [Nocardia arthritidis]